VSATIVEQRSHETGLGRYWAGLFLCNLVWALNPTAGKILIGEVGPAHAAWFRYFGAFAAYLVSMLVLRALRPGRFPSLFLRPHDRTEALCVLGIGLTTCFLSPLTLTFGLQSSTASAAAILIALEPVFTVLLGYVFLRERLKRGHLRSFILALLGFGLLSRLLSPASLRSGDFSASVGDLILTCAVLGDAMYSVFAKKLSVRHSGPPIFGSAMAIGACLLTVVTFGLKGIPAFGRMSASGWLAAFWIGPLGTAATYLYWLEGLRKGMSLAGMVLTLFVQPLCGALAGALVLGETLGPLQLVGGALIIASVALQGLALRPGAFGAAPAVGGVPDAE
jgi:drug/metabolite transporter (DMT)-like permease